jgi:hypothetical protein
MRTMDRQMVFEGPGQIQAARTKVIACATVMEGLDFKSTKSKT